MNTNATCAAETGELSRQARECISRPLFHADWLRVAFLHYEVEPGALQPCVPFPLDLRDGHGYVSLVAFTMLGLRGDFFSRASQWLLGPMSNHGFLNARTYVRVGEETGIYFLAEWLDNRLAVPFGRPLFGLPYRFGKLDYRHEEVPRVWHEPWRIVPFAANVENESLLKQTGEWMGEARLMAAHYSRGVHDVWMGHRQFLQQKI